MTCNFVYNTYSVDEDALAMSPTPCEELIRMRGQLESLSKGEALYSRRDANWVDWPEVQKARVAAEAKYKSLPPTPPRAKAQALKDWLIVSLHSCQPPDRVGVTRRLRLNQTIKRSGDGYVLDLTSARSHKTSRFCTFAPRISSRPIHLSPPSSLFCSCRRPFHLHDEPAAQ